LQALVKHDPALSEDEALKGALDALERLGPQVVFLRQGFNAAVDRYNLALDELPTRWAVPVLRLGQAGRL
jgi:hypothetical protein